MKKTVTLTLEDEGKPFDVELPFEAIEQMYGELGLSPGTGDFVFGHGGRACACGLGVVAKWLGLDPENEPIPLHIGPHGFDEGGQGNRLDRLSVFSRKGYALGQYFRQRLGEDLPKAGS